MRGTTTAIEVCGSGRSREALDARSDRYRDHVLFKPLVVADAGVAAGGQHIDEILFCDHRTEQRMIIERAISELKFGRLYPIC